MKDKNKCPNCDGKMWIVEYNLLDPFHYDGMSEHACENALGDNPTCRYRIGRFCGQPLDPKEKEPPYCTGKAHPVHI